MNNNNQYIHGSLYGANPESSSYMTTIYNPQNPYREYVSDIPKPPMDNQQNNPDDSSDISIDNILKKDSEALFDKILNTAFSIVSRVKIHKEIKSSIDKSSLELTNEMLEFERLRHTIYCQPERQKSTLTSELLSLEQKKNDEKLRCWQDLINPMSELISIFHQYETLKQDRKMLEGK